MIHSERLRAIEVTAQAARAKAANEFALLGVPFERTCDMRLVAMVLTAGTAEATPNLERAGTRLAGVLEGNTTCPQIHFEQYDPPVRQRFSIAHELGHFDLHARLSATGTALRYQRCVQDTVDHEPQPEDTGDSTVEAEADAYAGAFLLPHDDVLADIDAFGTCVAFLAERYGVSEATVRHRLRTLEVLRR